MKIKKEIQLQITNILLDLEKENVSSLCVLIAEGTAVLLGTATNAEILSIMERLCQTAENRSVICDCDECKVAGEQLKQLGEWLGREEGLPLN